MTVHDSSPTPPASTLAPEMVAAVRVALVSWRARPTDEGELQESLQRLAREARAKGVLAEQLLVVLKQTWLTLPELREAEPGEQVHLLQRVVTMCIKAYYDV